MFPKRLHCSTWPEGVINIFAYFFTNICSLPILTTVYAVIVLTNRNWTWSCFQSNFHFTQYCIYPSHQKWLFNSCNNVRRTPKSKKKLGFKLIPLKAWRPSSAVCSFITQTCTQWSQDKYAQKLWLRSRSLWVIMGQILLAFEVFTQPVKVPPFPWLILLTVNYSIPRNSLHKIRASVGATCHGLPLWRNTGLLCLNLR